MKGPVRFRPQMKGAIPFLDLLFVLLFSLLALSDTKKSSDTEAVRIRLPAVEPAAGEEGPLHPAIILEIDAESRVRLAGHPDPIASPADLDRLLTERVGKSLPDQFEIEIHGDARARHGVGVALLQHLRNKGFASVALLAVGDTDANWAKR